MKYLLCMYQLCINGLMEEGMSAVTDLTMMHNVDFVTLVFVVNPLYDSFHYNS